MKAAFPEEARKCAPNPAEAETENMHICAYDFLTLKITVIKRPKIGTELLRLP